MSLSVPLLRSPSGQSDSSLPPDYIRSTEQPLCEAKKSACRALLITAENYIEMRMVSKSTEATSIQRPWCRSASPSVNATRFDPGSPIPTCPTKFLFSLSPIESWPSSSYCSMNSHSAESPFHEVVCGFHPLPRETVVPDEPEKKDPQDFVGTQCLDVSFISIFLNPHRTAPHPMRHTADGKVIPRAIHPMSAHSISPVRNP